MRDLEKGFKASLTTEDLDAKLDGFESGIRLRVVRKSNGITIIYEGVFVSHDKGNSHMDGTIHIEDVKVRMQGSKNEETRSMQKIIKTGILSAEQI